MRERAAFLRYTLFLLILFFLISKAQSQTLFSFDDERVSKQEFLAAFAKNNASATPSVKTYRNYLDLYVRYKLKVKAAYDMHLDTLPGQFAELQNFRNQIVEPYLQDESSVTRLVNEAFQRSQRDINLQHIFVAIPTSATPADTLKAYDKIKQAYAEILKGKDFGDVAVKYSEDPFVQSNRGNIGYITVFSLPYELETLAYNTGQGKFSKIYRSRAGYHIFRNAGERKDAGRIRVAQILLVFPPSPSPELKAATGQRADSIYEVLRKGGDFAALARKFSGDNLSYQIGGEMPEFSVGKYDPAFESQAFRLTTDSAISKPFVTSFGYHILKRISWKPVSKQLDKATRDALRQQVMNDPRIEVARKEMLQEILKKTGYKKNNAVKDDLLWAITDSVVLRNKFPSQSGIQENTVLFSLGTTDFTIRNWLDYRKAIRNVPGTAPTKTNKELFDRFQENVVHNHYRNHLEKYNKQFAAELKEFRDGNLLFEIMQRKVWDRASTDSAGLADFYAANKNKYQWEPSADAIMFTFPSSRAADEFKQLIERNPSNWRRIVDSSGNQVQADSGRFELSHLPMAEKGGYRAKSFTSFTANTADNSVTAAYVVDIHSGRQQRSFQDARGLVINDFQNALEDRWIAELKKKYPVKIDEAVFNSLPK